MTKYISLSSAERNITSTVAMSSQVRGEVDLLYGTVSTEGASKGLLSSVGEYMSLEIVLDCCCV